MLFVRSSSQLPGSVQQRELFAFGLYRVLEAVLLTTVALAPGQSATHVHRTTHLVGDRAQLAAIAKAVLGADLDALPW